MAGKYATTGARIKRLRQAAGFRSAQAFADEVGVSRATVSAWENGTHYPSRFIGVIERLLGPVEDDADELDPQTLRTIQNMTPRQREQAIRLLSALLEAETARRSPGPGQRGQRRAES